MYNPKYPHNLKDLPPDIKLELHPNLTSFFSLTTKAQKEISELKGILSNIDNPEILLNSLYLQESVSSNAVENIHTTIESALEDETKPESERTSANKEVMNYRKALLAGYSSQQKYGLSSRTIKSIHKNLKLVSGVPGEFRQQQNSITSVKADGAKEIIYTPPVAKDVDRLISNFENFAHNNEDFVALIKMAICHYQFEAIHPFEDGNGRTGRILIVLQLVQDKVLDYPALFISGYLSKREKRYKELLLEVSEKNNWWDFIEFMIHGVIMQAINTRIALVNLDLKRFKLMAFLDDDPKKIIKKSNIQSVINHIFSNPTTQAKFMESETLIHWQTCTKYLNYLVEIKILKLEKRGRYKFYSNKLSVEALTKGSDS